MPERRRSLERRPARIVLTVFAAVCALGAACSDPGTRYRVLSFFFDGVPEPGTPPPTRGYMPQLSPQARAMAERAGEEQSLAPAITYSHAPYRDNQCNVCHNAASGLLFRTPQEGLCRKCHPGVPGQVPYVHGPVAVNDCTVCHSAHASAYPHLLLQELTKLCYRCHDRTGLTAGPHHARLDVRSCGECHHAHGGHDRYFLKNEASVARNP